MSITHSTLTSLFTDIADAIRAKTGRTAAIIADNFPDEIATITSRRKNDVTFYDYDGAQLYSYTAEAFADLEALPDNPAHEGLIAEGWNWTLSDAKTHVATYGSLDIGQMYTTASGATEIDISLQAPNLSPYLIVTLSGAIDINWGDGSEIEHIDTTGKNAIQHVYGAAGNYTIKLISEDQNISFSGDFYSSYAGVLSPTASASKSSLYSSTIQAIRLGNNATIGISAFNSCTQMKTITIPSGEDIISKIAFYHCFSLQAIVIPNTVTKLDLGSFSGCSSLESVCIPNTVTEIEGESFNNCKQLESLTLSQAVTIIKEQAFNGCTSIKTIILPSLLVTFEDKTLANCSMLHSAVLNHNGDAIPNNTFASCNNLTSVSLPNSIKYIRDNAFSGCVSLQSISLPASVTEINANAFSQCTSLSEIHFLSSTPPTITSSNAFNGIPTNCIIYVPTGKLSTYTSATNYPSSSTYTYMEE